MVGHAEPSAQNFPQFDVLTGAGTTAYQKPAPGKRSLANPNVYPAWSAPVEAPAAGRFQPKRHVARKPVERRVVAAPQPAQPVRTDAVSKLERARVLADKGEWQAAEGICRELIRTEPLDAAAHFTLALVLAHTAGAAEAQNSLRRAIYLERGFALAHYHLGLSLHAAGDLDQARKAFQNVVELLRTAPEEEIVAHGDGIRAGELKDLADMHGNPAKSR